MTQAPELTDEALERLIVRYDLPVDCDCDDDDCVKCSHYPTLQEQASKALKEAAPTLARELLAHRRASAAPADAQPVTLTYTNWRGETAERSIIPMRVWFGSTDWHPEPQWLLTALDVEKGAGRDFALKDFGKPPAPADAHPDDLAVDRFATAMKAKLAKKRGDGRGGWDGPSCDAVFLSKLLREHVEKGDPLDVGNLAMMLHQRGESIAAPADDALRVAAKAIVDHELFHDRQYLSAELNEKLDALRAALEDRT